jgi:UDP-N-acetylmuramoyl-tripeptide--D-alanyl-D-alanine ligase
MLTLADILESLTGIRFDQASQVITEASIDSRQVIPGALFIAIPGEHVDGHDFVDAALQRGAQLALIEKEVATSFPIVDLRSGRLTQDLACPEPPCCLLVENTVQALQHIARFWRRKLELRVVGITGSVGKSTTKELIAEVLGQRYRTLKNPGNLNNEIGLPLTLLRLGEGYEVAVLEMGFYVSGEIALLCDIALPQVGVVTNIGTVHAERAGSQEEIARGKAELVQSLPASPAGVAILNYDDHWVREMASKTSARVFFYGLDPRADIWADEVVGIGLEGIRFRLHYRNEVLYLRVPLIGRHSVHTVLRAAAVGLVEDLTWQEIVAGLRSGHAQLRLVAVRTRSGALMLDDTYNASPESTLAALNLLAEIDGHKIAVLGDMLELGPYAEQGHEMVGARAAEVADELVTVGELGRIIADSARTAGMDAERVIELKDTQEAIAYLERHLTAQDVVLLKGSHGVRMDRIAAALEYRK